MEKWKKSETQATEKLYEGQIYGINNDFEKQIFDSNSKIFELIKIKTDLLAEKLPNAAKYFFKFNNLFLKELLKSFNKVSNHILVEQSEEPLINENETSLLFEECEKNISDIKIFEKKIYFQEFIFQEGDKCLILLNDESKIYGTLTKISNDFITFLPDGGNDLKFSVLSLLIGILKLTK